MFANNEPEPGPVECRICHSKTTKDLILSPCLCKGSMGCVHIRCLEQWLNVSSHNFCELCSYRFEVIQVRRYSLLKSIRVWICQEQGSLYKAIFFIVISATNSILLSWMWFLWLTNVPTTLVKGKEQKSQEKENQEYLDQESQDISRPKWIAVFVFLSILTMFSIKSLCFDGYKAIKIQYHAWHRWWNETVNIQLVLDLENYKIKNKLEEFKDIPAKHNHNVMASIPIQNSIVKADSTDFPYSHNNLDTLPYDIVEIHNARKLSKTSIIETNEPTLGAEIHPTIAELEKSYVPLNKLSKDIPEIHGTRKHSMVSAINTTTLITDTDEMKQINGECEKPHHNNNLKESAFDPGDHTSDAAVIIDIPEDNYNPNLSLKDIPEVHKKHNNGQE